MTSTTTRTLAVGSVGSLPVTFTERGNGRPFLLLHGGAGPFSVAGFAELLASSGPARVITPVHPGFDGTPRPEDLGIRSLAAVYSQLIRDLGLTDVCVIGNSIGGWIAAELAVLESAAADRLVSSVVLVDAAGLQIEAAPIPDFFALTLDQVADLSYFRPEAFRIDPATLPDERKAALGRNRAALAAYGGTAMADPTLLDRLPSITIPALVIWGAADRMVPPEHGRAYAGGIPGAQFRLIADAGHLPQLEAPAELMTAVWDYVNGHATAGNTTTSARSVPA